MSDRYGYQFVKSLVPEKFILDGYVSIGSAGALSSTLPEWMLSITHNSTGNYTVVMGRSQVNSTVTVSDVWCGTLLPSIQVVGAGSSDHILAQVTAISVPVASNVATANTATTFTFQCYTASTLAAVDPSSGGGLIFTIFASNHSTR
jgi:hypothetical protein